jgi:signal transduction histidine kinase
MLHLIKKGWQFSKKNPALLYSLGLIVAVTAVLFFNTYFSLYQFQKNVDALLQSKAVLAENVVQVFAEGDFSETNKLQRQILAIKNQNEGVESIALLSRLKEKDGFGVVVSTDPEDTGLETEEALYLLAWSNPEGIAFLDNQGGKRFWNVVRAMRNEQGIKVGLVSFRLSLEQNDLFIERTIRQVYVAALLSLGVVLLIVINHLRIFRYATRAAYLEEVNRMKDDFVSMASHELKGPVTVIRGYTDLLRDQMKGKEKNRTNNEENVRLLDNLDQSAMRLNELIDDLLDVSRLEQNRIPIQITETNLELLVESLADQFRAVAHQKGLELVWEPAHLPSVSADAERVRQILTNLLSNAIKYTPKGKVEIITKVKEDEVWVTVADTGLGISGENLKNLFSKFYRIRNHETQKISGTGLGLWISRELAVRMGGDIIVESIEEVGSHFTLKLKRYGYEKN